MIARHEAQTEKVDIWSRMSAPVPTSAIEWRQDGKVITRDGRHLARFVAYVEANTVRERLDSVVPGEWDLTLELLPPLSTIDDSAEPAPCSFKARLQILGVIREDVGTGRDFKAAATDAFKRAAVRFGIAHELYAYEQNWVEMDGDGKNAKPVEDPAAAYARKMGSRSASARSSGEGAAEGVAGAIAQSGQNDDVPSCPKCGGRMWDNRATKRNPRAPDYKCRDRSCDGVIWPPRESTPARAAAQHSSKQVAADAEIAEADQRSVAVGADDIPF